MARSAPPTASCESPAIYRRRQPERTVLYQVVQGNLETWLAERWEDDGQGRAVPAWVERDLRAYLDCGILARGFARARCASCGHEIVVAFSCCGRGACPSCGTKRMVQVSSRLVDEVFPMLPVRQWVLSLPKRLRFFLHRDAQLTGKVLGVFLRAVETRLRQRCPDAPGAARFGGVSFVQRFGDALNPHTHFHSCLIDGVFSAQDDQLHFHEASALSNADVDAVQQSVRKRVLALFERRGMLPPEVCAEMLEWEHGGGFSLDAGVRIEADDRAGLERLLRYCARPPFAGGRLRWGPARQHLVYSLSRPAPDGSRSILLEPLELLDRLALLVVPPRIHRHRYCGVLAPNARLRAALTARAGLPLDADDNQTAPAPPEPTHPPEPQSRPSKRKASTAASLWAMLLARIYELHPLLCPNCGNDLRIIAFITTTDTIERILEHIGEPTTPPPIAPARAPPGQQLEIDQTPSYALDAVDPIPDLDLDQSQQW